jgi:hypothetical protein
MKIHILLLFPSITMATENGFFCSNCSYEEAVEIAKRDAAPTINCVFGQTPTGNNIEQCSSSPKRYFVVNERNRKFFTFTVYHDNQNSQRQRLTLATRDSSLSTEKQKTILKALDAKLQLFQALQEVASEMSGEVNSNITADPAAPLLNQNNVDDPHTDDGCNNDLHAKALDSNYRSPAKNINKKCNDK